MLAACLLFFYTDEVITGQWGNKDFSTHSSPAVIRTHTDTHNYVDSWHGPLTHAGLETHTHISKYRTLHKLTKAVHTTTSIALPLFPTQQHVNSKVHSNMHAWQAPACQACQEADDNAR
jgi:hypothetical protein